MALGIAFDLYRAARGASRPGPVLTAVGDVLFIVAAAIWVARVLWLAAWGEPRLYVLVAFATGMAAYFGLASPTVLPPARALWRGLFRLLRPLVRVVRWFGRMAVALGRALWPVKADPDGEQP
jgi:spore cortex biosynthesis protein YabQ